jgi:hypothetical protein
VTGATAGVRGPARQARAGRKKRRQSRRRVFIVNERSYRQTGSLEREKLADGTAKSGD